ncbi:ABC transporter substrate-binding protein [Luteipulveratus sp. YIM 133132]|uniref:ABC transporter substrate-binding protein n=1 Tax=Luteipulveratus flavus TaxID=3031728 RepID=UPI0023B149BF|nr:ABC transporter substrate-binding protein [Luteipulveratus sp. YIM 133132]MDE9366072.1 ABC transporter substrate-binding protein [Luteipulveratus sp. YIM 133132]
MRWTTVVALATAGTLSLAACGGSGSSGTNSNNNAGASNTALGDAYEKVPASAGQKPDVKGPAPEIPGAKKGGTLTFNSEVVPESTDPSTQYYQDTAAILKLTTRTLTAYRMEGGKSVLVPDMATDLGQKSKDGLQWKFTLKPNLKYDDGTPIKASDVAYSIKRSFATEELPGGPTFQIDYFKDGDKYKGPWKSGDTYSGVEADDAKGVITINLARKFETLPYFASFTMFGAIPKAKDTKTNYQLKWAATGPYKVQSYTKGASLTLVKNTNWDGQSDPARHQYPDTIQFNFGKDAATTAKAIMADNGIDQTSLTYDGVNAAVLQQALGAKRKQVASGPSNCVNWNGSTMDVNKIPLEVRKAVAAAWPIDQIHQAGGETPFDYSPGGTIGAPQVPGFTKFNLPEFPGKGQGDPAKAKAMLQAAGKLNFELSYYYSNDDEAAKNVNKVKVAQLQKAGFKVKAIGVSKTERRKKVRDPKAPVNLGQGVATGWCYDWPAGDSIYPPLFNSTLPNNGGAGNIRDKALDKEMADISNLPVAEQGAKWTALDKKILQKYVPLVPNSYSKGSMIFGSKVHNVVIDPNQGIGDFPSIWVG